MIRRHDIRHNDTQNYYTQDNKANCDTEHNSVIMLNVVAPMLRLCLKAFIEQKLFLIT
jgi:hypothetical protein